MWNELPVTVQGYDMLEFKNFIKKDFKPPRFKHFSRGNKLSNRLLTQIRVGRSDLNQHKFTIGLTDSPECTCHYREESPLHYFIDCFLYSFERQILFSQIEHYIPNFPNFNKHKKLDVILRGIEPENLEYFSTNVTLTLGVQNFLLKTKRFL